MTQENDKKSYGQILKSTGIIGGSQVVVILIGIVRTKIVALLIGPAGYGIMSALQSSVDLMRQATGFGINFSAVREISQHDDKDNVNRVLIILRRWALYTGILGTIVTILLSYPLSQFAFDNADYTLSIACVSIILLLTSISAAQTATLQGLRQLRKMAMVSIFGAFSGTITVIPLYYFLGEQGIVFAMIVTAVCALAVSWLYTRKIKTVKISLSFGETIKGGLGMAKLGLYLVLTSFIVTLIMYSVRAFIVREMDMTAVGWFQSAWSVANIYIGVVLSAMGADFFPRLTAIHQDNEQANKLINQQLEMVLLIISPLLVMLIGGADLIVNLLYSSKFAEAVPVLQWQLAGGILTVISWCFGIMFLAKNKGHYALLTESMWGGVYLLFVVFTWDYLGFIALGVGYVCANIIKTLIVYILLRKISKLTLTYRALRDMICLVAAIAVVLMNITMFTGVVQYLLSFTIFVLTTIYCLIRLSSSIDLLPKLMTIYKHRKADAKTSTDYRNTDL